jgi:hypothetical protein
MQPADSQRFLDCLDDMAACFSDPLTETQKRLYLRFFGDRVTLEEWEDACNEAMQRETFHKVPLPAVLWDYVKESREVVEQRQQAEQRRHELLAMEAARQERLHLEASAAWQAEQARLREDEEQRRHAWMAYRKEQGWAWCMAAGEVNPPNPDRWQPLPGEDPLLYRSEVDNARRKEFLRAQLTQLMAACQPPATQEDL